MRSGIDLPSLSCHMNEDGSVAGERVLVFSKDVLVGHRQDVCNIQMFPILQAGPMSNVVTSHNGVNPKDSPYS